MESVGVIHACLPAASGNVKISPTVKTVMSDGKLTNKTSRATAYLAVGTAENSRSILPKARNITCKMFPIPCWDWVYGVLCTNFTYTFKH